MSFVQPSRVYQDGAAELKVTLNVNGEVREVEAEPGRSLADVLRDQLGFTGVKRGCDSGGCGMCTVLVDERCVFSCMALAWQAEGKRVLTVEGLQKDGQLDELQEAFVRNFAPQCGYCTPAMLLAAKSLLNGAESPPTEEQVRDGLCGVLCRCTGYQPYIQSVLEVADKRKAHHPDK